MGFVKFERKIKDWGWYTDVNTFKVFFHLILCANYADKEYLGNVVKRGQVATSFGKLALETGLTMQQVRTAIKHLESTGEVTSNSQGKYTLFTVINYDLYQSEQHSNNIHLTSEQHSTNNRLTTNKEYKEIKEIQEVEEVVRTHACDDCNSVQQEQTFEDDEGMDEEYIKRYNTPHCMGVINGTDVGAVRLSSKQVDALLDELGLEGFQFYVEKLAHFIADKKAKVGGHYRLIRKWAREDAMI